MSSNLLSLRSRKDVGVINIGVMEGRINNKEDAIIMPSVMWGAFGAGESNHAERVVKAMRKYLPDPEKHRIHVIPPTQSSIRYCIDNDIKIINMSLASSRLTISQEMELSKHAFLITSAGNDGSRGETTAARMNHWLAVGAVDRNFKLRSYSSHGLGHVKTVAHDEVGRGTSFAAPVVTALLAQWYAWYYKVTGVYPNVRQTNQFVQINSHDLDVDGKDNKTGWGLFRLPWQFEATEVILTNDSKRAVRNDYTQIMDRELKKETRVLELNIEPRIENNRTLIGSRDASDLFGLNTIWDREKPNESRYVR